MAGSLHSPKHRIFINLLIEARKQAQLTQVQLASKLGVHQSFVSKYEVGERRLDVIEFIEIADALGIDIGGFIKNYEEHYC